MCLSLNGIFISNIPVEVLYLHAGLLCGLFPGEIDKHLLTQTGHQQQTKDMIPLK